MVMVQVAARNEMTTDEELDSVATALESSLAIVGCGPSGTAAASQFEALAGQDPDLQSGDRPVAATDERQAIIVAVSISDIAEDPDVMTRVESVFAGRGGFAVVIASVPTEFDRDDDDTLDRLRNVGDSVLLVREGTLEESLEEFLSLVGDTGVVNIDLADVRTLLAADGVALFSIGSATTIEPETAVMAAFDQLVPDIDTATATGALVDIVGSAELSVDGAASLVDQVRSRIGTDAHVIWGTAVDEAVDPDGTEQSEEVSPESQNDEGMTSDVDLLSGDDPDGSGESVRIRLVVSDVSPPEPTERTYEPGDPCPRCGNPLSGYSLGDRTTISCDGCGYAGMSVN